MIPKTANFYIRNFFFNDSNKPKKHKKEFSEKTIINDTFSVAQSNSRVEVFSL